MSTLAESSRRDRFLARAAHTRRRTARTQLTATCARAAARGHSDTWPSRHLRALLLLLLLYFLGLGRQVIALPISHKSWERSGHTDGTPRPPKEDVNAPDLYLPLMAFATYVLLFGYTLGARGTFTPEVGPSPSPRALLIAA